MGISILSYRGYIRIGLSVDTALISSQSSAQAFVDDISYQFHQLLIEIEEMTAKSPVHSNGTPKTKIQEKKIRRCICQKCRTDSIRDHIDISDMESGYSERASLLDVIVQCDQEDGECRDSEVFSSNCDKNFVICKNQWRHNGTDSVHSVDKLDTVTEDEIYLISEPFDIMSHDPDGFPFIDE